MEKVFCGRGSIAAPLLSVIIPTYNWSSVLPFSIASALAQTFTDFEVLVVGDGCTDDSKAVVESIQDDRVRWISLPSNSGHQSEPNNEGLRQARGELIAYLGHDDLWLPHHLSCLTAKLADGFDLVHAITGMVKADATGMQPELFRGNYERGMWLPPTGVLHRAEITAKLNGWRHYGDLVADPESDLWQRAYDAGYRFAFVPRLTALKFSASFRRDSYKIKSNVEQSHWTERIKQEPDLEVVELGHMLAAAMETNRELEKPRRYKDLLREFLKQTQMRFLHRLATPGRRPRFPAKGEVVKERRKFKGLDN